MINFKRVVILAKKELLGIKNDKAMIFSLCLLPVIFSIVLPIIILFFGAQNGMVNSIGGISEFTKNISLTTFPENLKKGSEIIYAILMYFFIPLFLLIPVMIATVISSSSFVGEKEKKTLEGLLYTPLTNKELVLGKILAAAIPAMVIMIASVIVYGLLIDTLGLKVFGVVVFPNTTWIIMIIILNPLIVFLSIALVIAMSQNVKTSKSAQSVAMILILPIIGGVISQASGAILFGVKSVLYISLILLIIDVISFLIISKLFNREKYILKN